MSCSIRSIKKCRKKMRYFNRKEEISYTKKNIAWLDVKSEIPRFHKDVIAKKNCIKKRIIVRNYLCSQCLSPLKLWVWTLFMARCTRYIVTCMKHHKRSQTFYSRCICGCSNRSAAGLNYILVSDMRLI